MIFVSDNLIYEIASTWLQVVTIGLPELNSLVRRTREKPAVFAINEYFFCKIDQIETWGQNQEKVQPVYAHVVWQSHKEQHRLLSFSFGAVLTFA